MGILDIVAATVFVLSMFLVVSGLIQVGSSAVSYYGDGCHRVINRILCSVVMIGIVFVCYRAAESFFDLSQETRVIETKHLVSLGNTEKINGTIYQGLLRSTTTMDEKPIYRFMYKKDDGSVAMGEIDASTPVKEMNDGKPRIETVKYCYTNKKTRLWLGNCKKGGAETTIYIPPNSIVKNFNINVTK